MRLAIVTTHPIQYYAPVFELLAKRIELKVFYTGGNQFTYDRDFQHAIQWDIPLLIGYDYTFIANTAKLPGTHHFLGIKNPNILKQITAFNPQHILIYGWANSSHFQVLRHFKNKVNILFRGDSNLLNKLPWWKNLLKFALLNWVYTHVDTALYTGTNNKAYFLRYGMKEEQLIFAPHAIDNSRFSNEETISVVKTQLGLTEHDILVLFAGKFNANKNPMLLLNAFSAINIKQAHLLFIGSGELEKEIKGAAEKHPNIHVLPFQNQQAIPAFYRACDLFCLPSKSESWGLAINEAMACSKAVLVSDKCGAAVDLVTDKNGRIFKSNELNDLKMQLKLLLSNPLALKKAGKVSKQIISKWNFQKQAEKIIKSLYA